jgi:hypothetical protein
VRPNTHNCVICGRSLAGRHHTARVCTDKECISAHRHPPKMRTCRWCGREFRARGTYEHCGSAECEKATEVYQKKMERERKKAQKTERVNSGRWGKVDSVAAKDLSPDSKYAKVYSVASKKPTRGHAGMHFYPSEGDASADAAWLFKGRKPEAPRPPLDVKKTEVAGGWRAIHKKKYDYHLQQKGKAAIV